jgi:hypothetical protein
VHPRPPVWVHPIDGISSWFALVLLGPGALVAQLTARHLLAPDALPPNWSAHVGAADEVALPLSAADLTARTGFLHWFVQTHWEAFTERPPTRLLQQLAASGNLRRDMGEAAVCVLMHALRTPTTVVPATILTTSSGAMMVATTIRDTALRCPHLLCVRTTQLGFLRGEVGWQVLAYLLTHRPCLVPTDDIHGLLPAVPTEALTLYSESLDLPAAPASIRELLPGGAFSTSRMPYLATARWARERLEERAAPSSDGDQARVLLLRWWDTHKPSATPTNQAAIAQMLGAHGGVPPLRSTSSSTNDTPSELTDFVDSLGGLALMDRVYLDTTANDSTGGQNRSLP